MVIVGPSREEEEGGVARSRSLAALSSGACRLKSSLIFALGVAFFAFAGVGLLFFLGVSPVFWVLFHERLVA